MIKLLLVDDERIIREGIEAMLPFEKLGIRLTDSCPNAFDALDSMSDDMPDILVTDIKMPRMDGLSLIERALTLNPMLRCVVLSGYDEFEFARRAMKMGVREYLLKPCTKQEMTAVLSRLCGDIHREQRCASEQLDEREARTADLAARLTTLIPDERTRTVTGEQVLTTARAMDGEALLREAYIYLIAHSESGAERGFEAIRQSYESNGELAEYIAKGLTKLHGQSGQYRAFVTQICTYIQTHYADANLSLQYLADRVVHMRADYIGREFIQDTGMKLSTYLLRVRMERAKAMLTASVEDKHIYEIAERVGLGHNPQYFSQLFRKYTGLTPKEYGKSQTKNNGI